jgi:hypothetical protein
MPLRFSNPQLQPNGSLKVSGPFSTGAAATDGQVLGDVLVRYLIIPNANPANIIDRVTTVPPGGAGFQEIVPAAAVPALHQGDHVRGIGLAVVVKRFPPGSATPSFETFTWCVDLTIV